MIEEEKKEQESKTIKGNRWNCTINLKYKKINIEIPRTYWLVTVTFYAKTISSFNTVFILNAVVYVY